VPDPEALLVGAAKGTIGMILAVDPPLANLGYTLASRPITRVQTMTSSHILWFSMRNHGTYGSFM